MKRFLALFVGLTMFVAGQAQEKPATPLSRDYQQQIQGIQKYETELSHKAVPNSLQKKKKGATLSEWYNIDSILINNFPDQVSRSAIDIHYDSLTRVYTNGSNSVGFHSYGMVFSPGEEMYGFGQNLSVLEKWNSYNFDSVRFPYWYQRPVDSITHVDSFTTDTFSVKFRVDGNYLDTFSYKRDTTWVYTNTDTSAITAHHVQYYNDPQNPLTVTSDSMLWPSYNVYDTSVIGQPADTHWLTPDSTIYNQSSNYTRIDSINTYKTEVIDTLIVQHYVLTFGDNYLTWNPPQQGPFAGDTIPFGSVRANITKARGSNPSSTEVIALDGSFKHNINNNQNARIMTFAPDISVSRVNPSASLDEPIAVATTFTFKPGYDYKTTDTLFSFNNPNQERRYKNNSFTTIINVFTGTEANEAHNNSIQILRSQRYNSPDLANYFTDHYYPNNPPPTQFPSSSNNARTAIYAPFGFHISADSTDNLSVKEYKDKNFTTKVYPNPVSKGGQVKVAFDVKDPIEAQVKLYNSIGQGVKNITNRTFQKGKHTITFNTQGMEPGIYFLNIETGNGQQQTRKISITK